MAAADAKNEIVAKVVNGAAFFDIPCQQHGLPPANLDVIQQIRFLLNTLIGYPPLALEVCTTAFTESREQDYIQLIIEELYQANLPTDKVLAHCRFLNDQLIYINKVYLPHKRASKTSPDKRMFGLLQDADIEFQGIVVAILTDLHYPSTALILILIVCTLHLLLMQEMAVHDPVSADPYESKMIDEICSNAKLYGDYVMEQFLPLWSRRLEFISEVVVTDECFATADEKFTYKITAFWEDNYDDVIPDYCNEKVCSEEEVNNITEVMVQVADRERNRYINGLLKDFDKALSCPLETVQAWHKVIIEPLPTHSVEPVCSHSDSSTEMSWHPFNLLKSLPCLDEEIVDCDVSGDSSVVGPTPEKPLQQNPLLLDSHLFSVSYFPDIVSSSPKEYSQNSISFLSAGDDPTKHPHLLSNATCYLPHEPFLLQGQPLTSMSIPSAKLGDPPQTSMSIPSDKLGGVVLTKSKEASTLLPVSSKATEANMTVVTSTHEATTEGSVEKKVDEAAEKSVKEISVNLSTLSLPPSKSSNRVCSKNNLIIKGIVSK